MKILFVGGQNSGKSHHAQKITLKLSKTKPYYIATYDNSFGDKSMQKKIAKHKKDRKNQFILIEQPTKLHKIIKKNKTYLIECISMWLLNHMNKKEKKIFKELDKLLNKEANIIFVSNNINDGVIPIDKYTQKFVQLNGLINQYLSNKCNKVYEIKYGIKTKLK
jgi:adenosylcobinamide kinase/adenosylcobinamide-phosphate guanylyltransferase